MSGETEHFDFTRYGFEWGAAKFERLASIDGRVVLRVSAGKRHVDIYVSAAGRSIRVFDDKNDELTANPTNPEKKERAMADWQPIETAPEEREVLVRLANGQITNARQLRGFPNNDGTYWRTMTGMVLSPHHWMPLPTPPSEGGEGR